MYQATFVPTVVAGNEQTAVPAETKIPWSNFRLVRGPTIIPDVPPLSAEQCVSVFGLGLIMSRFSAQGPMAEFREGPFRLAVHAMGVYSETPETAVAPVSLVDAAAGNAGKKASENRGSRNLVTFLLAPLFKIVFSEKKRRRKLARVLLAEQVRPWSFPKSRHCFISQLVTVQTEAGDCCPYIVQYTRYTGLTLFFYKNRRGLGCGNSEALAKN